MSPSPSIAHWLIGQIRQLWAGDIQLIVGSQEIGGTNLVFRSWLFFSPAALAGGVCAHAPFNQDGAGQTDTQEPAEEETRKTANRGQPGARKNHRSLAVALSRGSLAKTPCFLVACSSWRPRPRGDVHLRLRL